MRAIINITPRDADDRAEADDCEQRPKKSPAANVPANDRFTEIYGLKSDLDRIERTRGQNAERHVVDAGDGGKGEKPS